MSNSTQWTNGVTRNPATWLGLLKNAARWTVGSRLYVMLRPYDDSSTVYDSSLAAYDGTYVTEDANTDPTVWRAM